MLHFISIPGLSNPNVSRQQMKLTWIWNDFVVHCVFVIKRWHNLSFLPYITTLTLQLFTALTLELFTTYYNNLLEIFHWNPFCDISVTNLLSGVQFRLNCILLLEGHKFFSNLVTVECYPHKIQSLIYLLTYYVIVIWLRWWVKFPFYHF